MGRGAPQRAGKEHQWHLIKHRSSRQLKRHQQQRSRRQQLKIRHQQQPQLKSSLQYQRHLFSMINQSVKTGEVVQVALPHFGVWFASWVRLDLNDCMGPWSFPHDDDDDDDDWYTDLPAGSFASRWQELKPKSITVKSYLFTHISVVYATSVNGRANCWSAGRPLTAGGRPSVSVI